MQRSRAAAFVKAAEQRRGAQSAENAGPATMNSFAVNSWQIGYAKGIRTEIKRMHGKAEELPDFS